MVSKSEAKKTIAVIVVVLFMLSMMLKVASGVNPTAALFDTTLSALQVNYYGISQMLGTTPAILVAKVVDAAILPLLALLLASIFIDAIKDFDIRERRALSKVRRIKGHVIIAPYNRFARTLSEDLKKEGVASVIIAKKKRELETIYNHGALAIAGDPTDSESFEIAQIKSALCVIACSEDDTENAIISITAKATDPKVTVMSLVNSEENKEKMQSAGVYSVIMPETAAGEETASSIISDVYTKRFKKQ